MGTVFDRVEARQRAAGHARRHAILRLKHDGLLAQLAQHGCRFQADIAAADHGHALDGGQLARQPVRLPARLDRVHARQVVSRTGQPPATASDCPDQLAVAERVSVRRREVACGVDRRHPPAGQDRDGAVGLERRRAQQDALERIVPGQMILAQRRTLIGQVRLFADQGERAREAALPQRNRSLHAGMTGPDDQNVALRVIGICPCCLRPLRRSQRLEYRGVGDTTAFARRLQAPAQAPPPQRMEKPRHQLGARGAQRMTERDRPAINVERSLSPSRTEAALPALREAMRRRLAELSDVRRCDLVGDIERPLPVGALGRLLGLDDAAAERATALTAGLFHQDDGMLGAILPPETFQAVAIFLAGELARRTASPSDDLFSVLLAAKQAGAPLGEAEIVANLSTGLMAGNASIGHFFPNLVHALWRTRTSAGRCATTWGG